MYPDNKLHLCGVSGQRGGKFRTYVYVIRAAVFVSLFRACYLDVGVGLHDERPPFALDLAGPPLETHENLAHRRQNHVVRPLHLRVHQQSSKTTPRKIILFVF